MHPELAAAIDLYNRGEYLDSQVRFEQAMLELPEGDRAFAKGLLMLAGAMHLYFHRGGGRGTFNLMRQMLVTVDDYRPRHLGVEVEELFEAVSAYLEDLESRKSRQPRFIDRWLVPRIRTRR
jgi:hypothetical protein